MLDKSLLKINFRQIWGIAILMLFSVTLASATPHSGQSVKVMIIGGPFIENGGILITSGGDFDSFNFTNMAPNLVNATTISSFDTIVLNMASFAIDCNANTLTVSQKSDIKAFVAGGGKLIIYDSECTFGGSVNYSWLTFPFNTDNPGAQGSTGGTLTIVEENILSSNISTDPHFINTINITLDTDAVGDMNVVNLTTVDPHWCLDMTGKNALEKFGAVHMYARQGTTGLMIYNGMDMDYIGNVITPLGPGQLGKIWLQELQSTSSLLTCGQAVVGITLTPNTATNTLGTNHTLTATLKDLFGIPEPGILVTFEVVSGPNDGATGTNTTDSNGQATFTYTGSGGAGIDSINASFENTNGQTVTSSMVTKEWTTGGTTPTPTETTPTPTETTPTPTETTPTPTETTPTPVPEFSSLIIPLAGIFGLILVLLRRKE